MEKPTRKDIEDAMTIYGAEARIPGNLSAGERAQRCADFLDATYKDAKRLHLLYERDCNGFPNDSEGRMQKANDEARDKLETKLRERFAAHGLGLYLNGDPRGNPVGILTPKSGRYNTMGGAECGWRL